MITTRHIKRFFTLRGSDQLALVSLGFQVPIYQLGLKLCGYPRFQRLFIKSPVNTKPEMPIDDAKHQGQLVNMAVGGLAGGDNCLLRSVMLTRRLAKMGQAAEIKFGTNKNDPTFKAHSWVEMNGNVLNDREDIASSHSVFEAQI